MTRIRSLLKNPWALLMLIALTDLGMLAHVLPRATGFPLALFALVFVLTAPRSSALLLTLISLPLSPALPIPGFDTFALWRVIVVALTAREAWLHRDFFRRPVRDVASLVLAHEWIALALFGLGALSLPWALDPIAGMRKLAFLINAGLLYILIRTLVKEEPSLHNVVKKGLVTVFALVFLVGALQYLSITFVSLFDFWQGWALDTIPVLYGDQLGQVLANSNTWFSYYQAAPPTLRMFSLLPDSHSFGLLMVFAFLFTGALLTTNPEKSSRGKIVLRILFIAFGLSIFLSGSRGLWISAVPAAFLVFCALIWWQRRRMSQRTLGRSLMGIVFLFFLLFPIASAISSRAVGAGAEDARSNIAFERARSIFDLEELSNRSRIGIWLSALTSIAHHPLLGVGLGNTAVALNEDVSASRQGASAHNLYLDFAVETGIGGGVLSIAFFLSLLWYFGVSLLKKEADPKNGALPAFFVITVSWLAIYNLVDIVFLNDRVLLVFLTILALGVAHRQNLDKGYSM